MVLKGFERLDTIAGKVYGDATLWWVLAAASGIGWGLQVPPDTIVNIPNIKQVEQLIR
jgi:nucleoid-associated protein YgaU